MQIPRFNLRLHSYQARAATLFPEWMGTIERARPEKRLVFGEGEQGKSGWKAPTAPEGGNLTCALGKAEDINAAQAEGTRKLQSSQTLGKGNQYSRGTAVSTQRQQMKPQGQYLATWFQPALDVYITSLHGTCPCESDMNGNRLL